MPTCWSTGSAGITTDAAPHMAECFGTSERFWMNFQRRSGLEVGGGTVGPTPSRDYLRSRAPEHSSVLTFWGLRI